MKTRVWSDLKKCLKCIFSPISCCILSGCSCQIAHTPHVTRGIIFGKFICIENPPTKVGQIKNALNWKAERKVLHWKVFCGREEKSEKYSAQKITEILAHTQSMHPQQCREKYFGSVIVVYSSCAASTSVPVSVSLYVSLCLSLSLSLWTVTCLASMRFVAYKLCLLNFIMAMKLMFLRSNLLQLLSVCCLPLSLALTLSLSLSISYSPSLSSYSSSHKTFANFSFKAGLINFYYECTYFSPASLAISLSCPVLVSLSNGLWPSLSRCGVCGANVWLSWWPVGAVNVHLAACFRKHALWLSTINIVPRKWKLVRHKNLNN